MAKENNREEAAKHLPGHHPNSQGNLHAFQPSQSGNPTGRPKGSHNIRTILDKTFNRYANVEALKHLKVSTP
jgi:hypothetical protein